MFRKHKVDRVGELEPMGPRLLPSDLPVKRPDWWYQINRFDLSPEACAARQATRPKLKRAAPFKDKATKAFEEKVAKAIADRDWYTVYQLFIQYGTYLELVN